MTVTEEHFSNFLHMGIVNGEVNLNPSPSSFGMVVSSYRTAMCADNSPDNCQTQTAATTARNRRFGRHYLFSAASAAAEAAASEAESVEVPEAESAE